MPLPLPVTLSLCLVVSAIVASASEPIRFGDQWDAYYKQLSTEDPALMPRGWRSLISIPPPPDEAFIKKLAAVAPGCTLNVISKQHVVKKYRLSAPPRIYGFDELACTNEACVSHPSQHEGVPASFVRDAHAHYVCIYCDTPHRFNQVWSLAR